MPPVLCVYCVFSPPTVLRLLGVQKWVTLSLSNSCLYHVYVFPPANLLKTLLMSGVWLSMPGFSLCSLLFDVKMYFLPSLSSKSPTNVSWSDAHLTPWDLSFPFLLLMFKNKECVDLLMLRLWQCVSWALLCTFEFEVALKSSKNAVLCCFWFA